MPLRSLGKPARFSLALIFVAALWLAGLQWFTRSIMDGLPQAEKPADAIVVLTGGSNRIEAGFDLLKKGMGKKLFISGVYRGVEVKELMAKWKAEDSTELDCCVVLGEAEDTIGNARETAEWLRREKYDSYYLVTANYHMARAALVFRNFAPEPALIPWPVAPKGLDMADWWRTDLYRSLILREYSKYLVTLAWSIFA
jgi:uncharacterized SAM-binding protein YcdF (DUF218 family)